MKTHELVPCTPIDRENPIILGRRGKTRRQTVRGVGAIEPDDGSTLTISSNLGKVGAKGTPGSARPTTPRRERSLSTRFGAARSSCATRTPRHPAEFGEPAPS